MNKEIRDMCDFILYEAILIQYAHKFRDRDPTEISLKELHDFIQDFMAKRNLT